MLTRLADLASRRGRRVVVAAVVLSVVAGALGAGVASRLKPYAADDPASNSYKATHAIERATGLQPHAGVVALVRDQSPAKVARVVAILRADPGIGRVATYDDTHDRAMLSRDGRSTYVAAWIRRTADDSKTAKRVRRELAGRRDVLLGGAAPAAEQINTQVQRDLGRAELLAFPLLFLLAFWFFRSLVASLLPPLIGGLTIVLTLLMLRVVSELASISVFALDLVTGLGLGMAIDYSLFMVSRYREEIARYGPGAEALRATLTAAGRTVLFSSLTVAAAMASLLVFPQRFLYSMGVGGLLVALLAAANALIVLPAVLALLGTRVNALAPARLRRAADAEARPASSGAWYRLSRLVMRRPGRVAALSAGLLIALGLPFLGIRFTTVDARVLPASTPARQVDVALDTQFPPHRTSPLSVAAYTRPGRDVTAFARRIAALPGVAAVLPPRALSPGLTEIDVVTRQGELSSSSQRLVKAIRAQPEPFAVGVSGTAAQFVDLKASLARHIPFALAIIAVATIVVLFLMTGSVVLPIKALLMNVLTLSAAFGILVLVFQDGRLQGLLDYRSFGALDATQPILLFALAFRLSTDYGVFLLSRIKEARDAGAPNREAVAIGLERTGRIVTAAALLFCVAIGAFATSRIVFIKEVGVGTALAVLIDATIVRALLVPSLMELLGQANWWAPRPLRRLHARIGIAEAPSATPPAPVVPA